MSFNPLLLPKSSPLNTKLLLLPFFIIMLFFISFPGCSSSQKFAAEEEDSFESSSRPIRINLVDTDNTYSYVAPEQFILKVNGRNAAVVNKNNELKFYNNNNMVFAEIGSKEFSGSEMRLVMNNSSRSIRFDGKEIFGYIKVVPRNGKIFFINVLPIEEYLKGVVPAEMPVGSGTENFEALKAMAICARTYAYIKMNQGNPVFDVYDSVSDQVYGGLNRGNRVSDLAVEETSGMILTYNGKPAVTLYYSTCGGQTEDGKNVFSSADYPYLASVSDNDPSYCEVSPRFQWEEQYTKSDITDRLFKAKLLDSESYTLKDIKVISRFSSGRVNQLDFLLEDTVSNQKTVSMYGNRIRGMLRNGANTAMLNSNWFDVELNGETVMLRGRGYGHGVGLCQYGAMTQSKLGHKYDEILQYYYPGTKISSL